MSVLDTAPGNAVADDETDIETGTEAAADAVWAELAAARGSADADAQPAPEDDEDAEPEAEAAPATSTQADIWAGASEAHREAYRAAEARAAALEQRIRSDDGRVRAYQQQIEDLKRKGAATAAPAAQDDGLRKIAEDYPEILNPIIERFSALEGALTGMTDGQRAAAEAATLAGNEAALTQIHPDWLEIRSDPRLVAWVGTQPQYVRQAAETNGEAIVDVEAAADLVSRFKQSVGIAPAGSQPNARPLQATPSNQAPMADRRRRQLEASTGTSNRAPAAASGVPEDPDAQWAYFKAKREREEASHR